MKSKAPRTDIVTYTDDLKGEVVSFLQGIWKSLGREWQPNGLDSDVYEIPIAYQAGGGEFWIVYQAREVIGTAALKPLSATVTELKRFYILPQHRGRLGKELFRLAYDRATAQKFTTLRLDTSNEALHRVLQRAGFRDIAPYNANNASSAFMELWLVPSDEV